MTSQARGATRQRNGALRGVYVGERTNDRATSVGYAVPVEDLGDWIPEPVGRSLAEEVGDVVD